MGTRQNPPPLDPIIEQGQAQTKNRDDPEPERDHTGGLLMDLQKEIRPVQNAACVQDQTDCSIQQAHCGRPQNNTQRLFLCLFEKEQGYHGQSRPDQVIDRRHIVDEIVVDPAFRRQDKGRDQKCNGQPHSADKMQGCDTARNLPALQTTVHDKRRNDHLQDIAVDRVPLDQGRPEDHTVMDQSDDLQNNNDHVGDHHRPHKRTFASHFFLLFFPLILFSRLVCCRIRVPKGCCKKHPGFPHRRFAGSPQGINPTSLRAASKGSPNRFAAVFLSSLFE